MEYFIIDNAADSILIYNNAIYDYFQSATHHCHHETLEYLGNDVILPTLKVIKTNNVDIGTILIFTSHKPFIKMQFAQNR